MVLHTLKKSLLIVKLHSFQNASIEIKQMSFIYQHNRVIVKKPICKMQNKNNFTNKEFILSLKRNPLTVKGLYL